LKKSDYEIGQFVDKAFKLGKLNHQILNSIDVLFYYKEAYKYNTFKKRQF